MGLVETLKLAAAALRDAGVPFALAGSAACWARGAPAPRNDIDFAIRHEDRERAEDALAGAGMRIEHPPEGWLLKAWHDDILVDVLWELAGSPPTAELLARAEERAVEAVPMPVLALDDVITSKLCAFDENALDYSASLSICRALREQVDWPAVRARTTASPYARGFLALLEELHVIDRAPRSDHAKQHPTIRVLAGE
jgi:Uncharacterised nucleotidyltransferase